MAKDEEAYKKLMPEGAVLVAKMKANLVLTIDDPAFVSPDNPKGRSQEMLSFYPVYSEDENSANRSWSRWTPGGKLELQVSNPGAFDKIKEGEEYFVFVVPVPDKTET